MNKTGFWYSFILFLLSFHLLAGQASTKEFNQWKDHLSLRSDPYFKHFKQVLQEIQKPDTSSWCVILNQLDEQSQQQNIRYQIRLPCLKVFIYSITSRCSVSETLLSELKSGLQKAYELEDKNLIELGNRSIAAFYHLNQEYGLALMHQRIVVEMQDEIGVENFATIALDRYILGDFYYYTRQYANAIHADLEALKYDQRRDLPVIDTLNAWTRMFLMNTLGLAYEKSAKYDSAFWAFDKALEIAKRENYTYWVSLLKGNRGDVFFELGQYDSSRVLLELDVQNSLEGGKIWADNAANSMQKLARIDIHQNHPHQAIDQLRVAEKTLKILYQPNIQAQIYYAYMLAYQQLGEIDSLFAYTEKYIILHDEVERKASDERAEIVEVRYNNQENIHEILSLNKEKKRIALIRNFVIILTLLLGAVGLLYISRQKLKMRIQRQKMEEEKRMAEAEASGAKEQLSIFTNSMLEKNNMVEKLQAELSQKEVDQDQQKMIEELSRHTILNDEDWDRFRHLFEKVHPGFFIQLKLKSPDISLAEQRIAAFSKLRISTKEAANLLGISPASVNKSRQRLRSRMGLDPETDLELYFAD